MTAREAKHQYMLTEWTGRITERSKSGMTIRSWCAANDISERVYHYWLRKVRGYASQFLPAPKSADTLCELPEQAIEANPERQMPETKQHPDTPTGWAICKPEYSAADATRSETVPAEGIMIEIGKSRIKATAETDPALLKKVCGVLMEL